MKLENERTPSSELRARAASVPGLFRPSVTGSTYFTQVSAAGGDVGWPTLPTLLTLTPHESLISTNGPSAGEGPEVVEKSAFPIVLDQWQKGQRLVSC